MLPDRSKRYANIDGEIPRLELASTWHLFLVALLVLALFVMIFPRKQLVEKLYEQEALDELTVSYVQNLYRADTRNTDVAILLARIQQDQMDLPTLESVLLQPATQGEPRQRIQAQLILVKAYGRALDAGVEEQQRALFKQRITVLMSKAVNEALPPQLARSYADLAFELDLPLWGAEFLAKFDISRSGSALEHQAQETLAKGEYALASQYYLMARDQATELTEARRLYMAGIDTLMAASQFSAAMQAARQHLGTLAEDRATLRYLARVSLAAGDPAQAAYYARALVFEAGAGIR